jgi:hypothetical protein
VNWKRTPSLATPDRFGKSSPITITPPRAYCSKNTRATSLLSSTWQKSAQLTDSMGFQVPVFCGRCALFPCKPSVFNILTKTPGVICAPVLTKFSKRRRYEGTDAALKGRRYIRRDGDGNGDGERQKQKRKQIPHRGSPKAGDRVRDDTNGDGANRAISAPGTRLPPGRRRYNGRAERWYSSRARAWATRSE